jgi:diketogulonate reductase-like aldo/keto reductase
MQKSDETQRKLKPEMVLTATIAEELAPGTVILAGGVRMPRLGVGTAGRAGLGLAESLRQGVRLVDTASMYNNEELLANAFAGMQRSELFVVSKAWPFASSVTKSRSFNSPTKPSGELIADVTRHIAALNTSYLDLLLIHWPTAALREHWSALIELKARGLVRAIGLSNADVKHVQLLDGAEEPPALVQTELGLIRKDGRIPLASLEQLVEHCGRRGIRMMSHSPLKAALRNRKAQQFAKQLNVSVARLALRYGLERGLVQIFSSSKPAHILDNLRALYEPTLGASILSELASWRLAPGEKMRAPSESRSGARCRVRCLSSSDTSRALRSSSVQLFPGEVDPVALGPPRWDWRADLRAAADVEALQPWQQPRQSLQAALESLRLGARSEGLALSVSAQLEAAHEVANEVAAARSPEAYHSLVARVGARARALLSDTTRTTRLMQKRKGAAAQHVITLGEGFHNVDDFAAFDAGLHAALLPLYRDFIAPHVSRAAFPEHTALWTLRSLFISRNANDFAARGEPQEDERTKSLMWHWDNLKGVANQQTYKAILYLNDVDHRNGCLVALRHNVTGLPVRLARQDPVLWGARQWSAVPKVWLAQLAADAYVPHCLSGRAGTLILFDTNIVHRGSRPAAGLFRDFILFEFGLEPERAARRKMRAGSTLDKAVNPFRLAMSQPSARHANRHLADVDTSANTKVAQMTPMPMPKPENRHRVNPNERPLKGLPELWSTKDHQARILGRYLQRIRKHVLAMGTRGAEPDVSQEAYAMLWHTQAVGKDLLAHPAFITMKVLIASIRRVDPRRAIILMVISEHASRDPHMRALAVRYAPLHFVLVPLVRSWTIGNNRCEAQINMRLTTLVEMVRKHSAILASALGKPEAEVASWVAANISVRRMRHTEQFIPYWNSLQWLFDMLLTKPELAAAFKDKSIYGALVRPLGQLVMLSKTGVYNLTASGRFTRILYVDTDTIALRPFEELWQLRFAPGEFIAATMTLSSLGSQSLRRPPFHVEATCAAVSPDGTLPWLKNNTRPVQYNAGAFLVRPDSQVSAALMRALHDKYLLQRCAGDQSLFNTFFRIVTRCIGHLWNCYDPLVLGAYDVPWVAGSRGNVQDRNRDDMRDERGTRTKCFVEDLDPTRTVSEAAHEAAYERAIGAAHALRSALLPTALASAAVGPPPNETLGLPALLHYMGGNKPSFHPARRSRHFYYWLWHALKARFELDAGDG